MSDLEKAYFDFLLGVIDPDGVTEGVAYISGLLHNCDFTRRVGRDVNRAANGVELRGDFLDLVDTNMIPADDIQTFLNQECSWLEMMLALSRQLDFLYEGGIAGRYFELINNMGLGHLASYNPRRTRIVVDYDQRFVRGVTARIDNNQFDRNGHGGMFPLRKNNHPDQREVEIWDQHSAYFKERMEGVLWTSTN